MQKARIVRKSALGLKCQQMCLKDMQQQVNRDMTSFGIQTQALHLYEASNVASLVIRHGTRIVTDLGRRR